MGDIYRLPQVVRIRFYSRVQSPERPLYTIANVQKSLVTPYEPYL